MEENNKFSETVVSSIGYETAKDITVDKSLEQMSKEDEIKKKMEEIKEQVLGEKETKDKDHKDGEELGE